MRSCGSGGNMSTSPKQNKRSPGSIKEGLYHGLINQGSTCYLNSVLQVLFMTTEFREAVKRYATEHQDTSHIDKQLSALFDNLRRRTATTVGITTKLGIHNVRKQSDAAEHLMKILTLTSHEASQIFEGKLVNKTTCLKCKTETEAEEPFWFLPVALDDSYSETCSVRDSMAEFFKKSVLSGEDQLHCEHCDDKSDASMVYEMGHHQDVLILLLKRFEFNYNSMSFIKNSCPVVVPCSLEVPKEQIYDLYGFVEHFGSLKSGHYTATVKSHGDGEDRWYNFNDSSVEPLNRNRSPMDNEKNYPSKSRSAYVLFYRKRKHTNNNRKPSTNSSTQTSSNWRLDVTKKDGVEGDEEADDNPTVKSVVVGPFPDPSHTVALDNRAPGKQRGPEAAVSDHQKAAGGEIAESRADDSEETGGRGSRCEGQGSVKMQERAGAKAGDDKVERRSDELSGGHGRASQDAISTVSSNGPPTEREESPQAIAPEAEKQSGFWSIFRGRSTGKDDAEKKQVKEEKKQKKRQKKDKAEKQVKEEKKQENRRKKDEAEKQVKEKKKQKNRQKKDKAKKQVKEKKEPNNNCLVACLSPSRVND